MQQRLQDPFKSHNIIIPKINYDVINGKTKTKNDTFILDQLFSDDEKHRITKQKTQMEIDLIALKDRLENLKKTALQSKSNKVFQGELFLLKFQTIDDFASKNILQYNELLNSYFSLIDEIHEINKQITISEYKILLESEKISQIIEENDSFQKLYHFSDFLEITFPKLSNYELYFDRDVSEKISWAEERLKKLRKEIVDFDGKKYNEKIEKDAALSMASAQKTMNDKSIVSTQQLRMQIDELNGKASELDNTVQNLNREVDELRCKKVKNDINFSMNKTKIKSLHKAQIECFKNEMETTKNLIRQLRREINAKADEYDFNCKSLLNAFEMFEGKIENNKDIVKTLNFRTNENENPAENETKNTKIDEIIQEEEELYEEIEVDIVDHSDEKLLQELEKRKLEQNKEIEMLKKQLNTVKIISKRKINHLLEYIHDLQDQEEKYQKIISRELIKIRSNNSQKVRNINRTFDKIENTIGNIKKNFD
ncbi:hypothetical protein TRFO_32228 [Tritrichomonas foetus]|uniref:Uncharacterized protein n=1 Tax=Tritrichomonas foetus TaxID=1144522 RepID=A0A1J4JTV5_9EUKA|nr:hypothetical protein TRFO_32228 [Tritrichomonas foetus]|eukprot:OHT00932.1 hypothetical protein TRFO_32228 [Tritrichomonas foetus]